MLSLFELLGELLILFGLADATTREDNRTAARSALLLAALAFIALGLSSRTDLFASQWLEIAALLAAEIAAGLALVTVLHAARPVGEDLPARTWAGTYARCVGPLLLTAIGGGLLGVCALAEEGEPWVDAGLPVLLGVCGGLAALAGLAALVRAARRPF